MKYEFDDLGITIERKPYDIIFPWLVIDKIEKKTHKSFVDFDDVEIARMYAEALREREKSLKEDWWNY